MLLTRPLTSSDSTEMARPLVAWEETPCLLCGRDDASLLTEAADPIPASGPGLRFAVVQCRHCRLVYTNPRPTLAALARFYPPNYPPHLVQQTAKRKPPPSRLWSRVFGRPSPERRGRLPWPRPGRLLDFGCGGGSFLAEMAEDGWQVTGIDTSIETVHAIRKNLGCDALAGSLPHPDLAPCSFDVITMWQSLEHVHRPLEVLRAAYELLVPGGKLIVAVPNYDGQSSRWFGENWFGLDLPRHLIHFTPATLAEMLQAAGFRIDSVRGLVHADWLWSSGVQATAVGADNLAIMLLRWKTLSRFVAWICYLFGRADSLVAVVERPE
jgi:2-polyprenyl-3-methyl-5-hydroxy-6-metoxy-1,4-benzoquinol methylase